MRTGCLRISVQCTVAQAHFSEVGLEGDIKGCFDHISHDWLLANIPMDKNILKQFLKSGFIYQRELFPTEEGTPQGGIISPILANMTLDGIEKKLVERFHTNALGKVDSRFKNAHKVNFVRYADILWSQRQHLNWLLKQRS